MNTNTKQHNSRAAIPILALCLPVLGMAQALSPYSTFQAMTVTQLQTAQVKLTYMGPQNALVPSVGLAVGAFNLSVFVPFRRPGLSYLNDDFVPVQTGTVSAQNIKTIIDSVGMLPSVTGGGDTTAPFVVFALSNTSGGAQVFEALLSPQAAAAVFDKLRAALLQNSSGLLAVSTMACPLGLLDPSIPGDVTSSTSVTFSGFRLNRATGRFVGTATVANTSGASIPGPLFLVVQFGGNIRVVNASGATCGTQPVGILFVTASQGSLAANSSVVANFDLANPNSDPIQPELKKVLSGPGTP